MRGSRPAGARWPYSFSVVEGLECPRARLTSGVGRPLSSSRATLNRAARIPWRRMRPICLRDAGSVRSFPVGDLRASRGDGSGGGVSCDSRTTASGVCRPGPRPEQPAVGPLGYRSVSVEWFVPWRTAFPHHQRTLAPPLSPLRSSSQSGQQPPRLRIQQGGRRAQHIFRPVVSPLGM